MSAAIPVNRNIALDGLRGFGALIVLFWHTAVVFFPTAAFGSQLPQSRSWQLFFYNSPFWLLISGSFAVNLFFVLSGYVLTFKYFRAPDLQAMVRRILGRWPRLLIPAGVSTICYFLVAQVYPRYCDTQFLPALRVTGSYSLLPAGICLSSESSLAGLLDNLFWRPWFLVPDFSLLYNDVLWTMYVELSGSFIAMFVAITTATMASRRVGVVSILVVALVVLFAFPPGYGIYFSMFLAGTAVAFIDSWFPFFQGFGYLVGPTIFAFAIFLGGYNGSGFSSIFTLFRPETVYFSGAILITGFGAFLFFFSVLKSNKIGYLFALPPLLFLGRISFSLYLMHSLVITHVGIILFNALRFTRSLELRSLAAAIVSVFVSIAVAALMTKLVDEPSVLLARRLSSGLVPIRKING